MLCRQLVLFGRLSNEDERKKIETSAKQVEDLEEIVFYLKSKFLEANIRMLVDVERRKLPNLKRNFQENLNM